MELPDFTDEGVLPPGDYGMTIADLRDSMLVHGGGEPGWDTVWRAKLVTNLETMVAQLSQVGIFEVFVDGSFVEAKCHPNDIDGYFHCSLNRLANGELERELNLLDPLKSWTWDPSSRRAYRGYRKKQLPMWHAYRVELFPHYGQPTGIRDKYGHELEFPSAFRQSRSGEEKGIVKILQENPDD